MRRTIALALTALACLAPAPARAQTFRADRLEQLADHLDKNVQPRNFNIYCFGTGLDASDPSFVGCAGAHATYPFASDGLRMKACGGFKPDKYAYFITDGRRDNFRALEHFFGLESADTMHIFGGTDYTLAESTDPKAAARRIRAVIRAHAKEKPPEAVASK